MSDSKKKRTPKQVEKRVREARELASSGMDTSSKSYEKMVEGMLVNEKDYDVPVSKWVWFGVIILITFIVLAAVSVVLLNNAENTTVDYTASTNGVRFSDML